MRAKVDEKECNRLTELYSENPYSVHVIKAYRGAI